MFGIFNLHIDYTEGDALINITLDLTAFHRLVETMATWSLYFSFKLPKSKLYWWFASKIKIKTSQ